MANKKRVKATRKRMVKRDQAKLVAESQAALRELAQRIPRRFEYGDEMALLFDARQARVER